MVTKKQPQVDPFQGEFSQERVLSVAPTWAVLQWHGGLAALAGEAESVKVAGGFFVEDNYLADLGLVPDDEPLAGFVHTTLRLGGKNISGWGAKQLTLSFLFTEFHWEERETGVPFAAGEYERRKQQQPGSERTLRGRIRALVGVKELLAEGLSEPLMLSVRGTYSAKVSEILKHLQRMALEASRLRRQAGLEGAIAREAFWAPIYAGPMEEVGEGSNTSIISRPIAALPTDLTRDALLPYLVEEHHRRPGGTFDQWAALYKEAWLEKVGSLGEVAPEIEETTPAPDDDPEPVSEGDPLTREQALEAARASIANIVGQLEQGDRTTLRHATGDYKIVLLSAMKDWGFDNSQEELHGVVRLMIRTLSPNLPLRISEAKALRAFFTEPTYQPFIDAIWPAAPVIEEAI